MHYGMILNSANKISLRDPTLLKKKVEWFLYRVVHIARLLGVTNSWALAYTSKRNYQAI